MLDEKTLAYFREQGRKGGKKLLKLKGKKYFKMIRKKREEKKGVDNSKKPMNIGT